MLTVVISCSATLLTKSQEKPEKDCFTSPKGPLGAAMPFQNHSNKTKRANLVVFHPVQSLHPQVCHEPVVALALPCLVVMPPTRPMILWVRSLRADVIDDSENCLDLVRTGLLKLAWTD